MSTPPAGPARRLAITTFKFAGVASLGLLTGSTLSLTSLTAPSLLSLSDHTGAAACLTTLRGRAARLHRRLHRTALGALALAYLVSPRGWRHPYLLWTALVAGVTAQYALATSRSLNGNGNGSSSNSGSGTHEAWWSPRYWRWISGSEQTSSSSSSSSFTTATLTSTTTTTTTTHKSSGKDGGYSGRTSPGTGAGSASQEWELEMGMSEAERAELGLGGLDDVNGEAVRLRIETWGKTMARLATGYALAGAMALVGLWGDGFAG